MADVLARIVARKRTEVAARLSGSVDAEPTRRSLRAALARPGARFIMEVKRASPSGHRSAVSVEAAVAAYAPVADAISVLTDTEDFGGSLDDLKFVRARFDGPILAKDFIVDPAQVSEARASGADAVLVMMSVLDDSAAAAVLGEAKRFDMDAIVEVHDEQELQRALALGASIVGINNRDLKTLSTDLRVTERLAPLVPPEVLVISESGISSHAEVMRLAPIADAFLVGSALMAATDVVDAARSLVHGQVKLCGLTRSDDVELAGRAGATHAGFIFVPGTPRAVTPDQARGLVGSARQHGLKTVGVFRDRPVGEVASTARELGLDVVQLHGSEDVGEVRSHLPDGTEIWAVSADGAPQRAGADRTLFDSKSGGSGVAFDWSRIGAREDLGTGFLGGGIGPANVVAATRVGAYGLDVGSAVEAAPGEKDPVKVKALFDALRPACRGELA
ncbi:MAG: bifunctional indole-3-glycerol-phosphate synthase TrpC/phosphoribosylanthranilate isomerase TrpF [Pseudomonadota bacterium]|nr:bifunctional indole-3-glycerol-phosphate synthase TrpC/phosphoribosylanthranilate isomerase TrpF [Pseudomonadota bacterium]